MSAPSCVLLTDDYLPHLGGSRIYYHMVASLLPAKLAVVTREADGTAGFDSSVSYRLQRLPLRAGRAKGPRTVAEIMDALTLARAALTAFGQPVCLLAGEVVPSAVAAFIAGCLGRIPYGVFVHDEPLSGAGRFETTVRRALLRRAGAIIASSSFAARRARDCAGESVPIFVAPPGVDIDEFSPGEADSEVLQVLGVSPYGFLLSVGRLVDYKNIGLLIRTVARARDMGLCLVIVGEGPDRARLEQEARDLGVEEAVKFVGRVPRGHLANLYRGALAHVFPSRRARGLQHEGIGMAALEAAASGCVVMASTETSAGDFVRDGETGFLFDAEDENALASLVRRLNDRPAERARLASSAAAAVRRDYTWEAAAKTVSKAIGYLPSGPH